MEIDGLWPPAEVRSVLRVLLPARVAKRFAAGRSPPQVGVRPLAPATEAAGRAVGKAFRRQCVGVTVPGFVVVGVGSVADAFLDAVVNGSGDVAAVFSGEPVLLRSVVELGVNLVTCEMFRGD